MRRDLTLLDACAVVNLYATRWMGQILAAVDGRVAIVDIVEREAQYVFRGGRGDDARERELVDLRPLIATGHLSVASTTDERELLTFLDLSVEVDDEEAMTAALAIHRGATVVTDDRKALRVLANRGVRVRSSLDLVKTWADRQPVPASHLRIALIDLRQRGNYEPGRAHPLRPWWEASLAPSGESG